MTELAKTLEGIVGAGHVRVDGPAHRYAVDGVVPTGVVLPGSVEEVSAVLAACSQAGAAVVPWGGGSSIGLGGIPQKVDVVLCLSRLNRVLDYEPGDMTSTVQAGMVLSEYQARLKSQGQFLALDSPEETRATIGGILATNDSGTLRLGYGALRDLIIGVTLALADGTIASSGGKVVKNVAGYDLPKLATGSLGTLGVITRAVFRLHPLPRNTRTLTIAVGDADAMQRVILSILGEQLAPAAVQARDGNVDILLEGTLDGIAAQESVIKKFGEVREGSPAVWKAREELWPSSGAGPIVKFTTLPSRVSAAVAPFSRFVIQATGIGYARFDGDVQELRTAMERDGGSLTILGATQLDVWGSPGDALPLMRAVKEQFDPKGTLNPGRFVGGI